MHFILYLVFSQIYVDSSAPPGGDGLSWATAFNTFEPALVAASTQGASEIRLGQGIYFDGPQQGFTIPSNLSVRGGYAGRNSVNPDDQNPLAFPTIFDGDTLQNDDPNQLSTLQDNLAHLFVIENASGVLIEGVQIQNMQLANSMAPFLFKGTGVSIRNGQVQLNEIQFKRSYADGGGCYVFAFNSELLLRNSSLIEMHRGAIAYLHTENSDVSLESNFFGAAEIVGGGASIQGGSLFVRENTFEAILATLGASQGGAIEARAAEIDIRGVISRQCFANDGGAFFFEDCIGDIVHCLFEENHSSADTGGAITQNGGEINYALCRFYSNLGEIALGGGFALVSGQANILSSLFVNNMTSLDFPPTTFNPGSGVGCTSEGSLNISLTTLYGHPLFDPGGTVASIWGHIEIDRSIIWSDETLPDVTDRQLLGQWPAEPTPGTLNITQSNVEGWNASVPGKQVSADRPPFIAPLGSDGILGTTDDNLRLSPTPPLPTSSSNLPRDLADVDEDGDRNELMIWDLDGYQRFSPHSPQIQKGAYAPRSIGDWDANQHINIQDFINVQNVMGTCPPSPYPCPGDWNGDLFITETDLLWHFWG